jgi:hypothetical protein
MTDPNVISVGDDYREWPRETWGTRDQVRAAREERARAEVERLTKGLPSSWQPYEPGARDMPGFRRLNAPRSRASDPRGRRVDKILEHLGIEPGRRRNLGHVGRGR